ncbi:187-kDa microtubule-associated protein air9 [Orobanche hederae]
MLYVEHLEGERKAKVGFNGCDQWSEVLTYSRFLETGRMYEAHIDDVGYRLVATYTPVREDGVEGQPVSASTDPIAVEHDFLKEVKQKLDLGAMKFEALCNKDRSPKRFHEWEVFERRILEANKKRVKVVKPGSKTSFPLTI